MENPWIETSRGKSSKSSKSPPAHISLAAAAASKPKITTPQPKYDNIPTSKFMAPMPKKTFTKRTGNYGKRYMVYFKKDEKPTKGTALPIQAVVSEINRTCVPFHIKANSAEWTPAMNLMIYFTHDSAEPQIEKARKTILGAIAKGTTKTVFLKAVKWSRIIIRDVPTQKWISDESAMADEDTGMIPGDFAQITLEDLEEEIRKSHPILKETVFLEGPAWTKRGDTPTKPRGNVSFTIPDPDEAHLRILTRNPLLLFHTPCFLTRWIEKIKLDQCIRCWKYGKTHPDCPVRCHHCGGGHDENDHNVACKKCKKSADLDQEDRKKGLTICTHPIACPNCNENHHADDASCKMRNHAACEERQRRKIGRGQTFISTYLENQHNAEACIDTYMS